MRGAACAGDDFRVVVYVGTVATTLYDVVK